MARMRSVKDRMVTSLSVAGKLYEADDDGTFDVAEAHVADAISHGLELFENKAAGKVKAERSTK